ncbi:hypothetical protein H8S75_13225 [Hungatella sp. L12]|uniref:Uncharacterized protein n=1 Tax=Hungatella hominis TaxID=2763050 RepID=A0ABR7H709_9FIRM|nr:hypothetical protein [Hungatella hominis]MBC5708915.1 hypothetical protein [Hungatella hominis]
MAVIAMIIGIVLTSCRSSTLILTEEDCGIRNEHMAIPIDIPQLYQTLDRWL